MRRIERYKNKFKTLKISSEIIQSIQLKAEWSLFWPLETWHFYNSRRI